MAIFNISNQTQCQIMEGRARSNHFRLSRQQDNQVTIQPDLVQEVVQMLGRELVFKFQFCALNSCPRSCCPIAQIDQLGKVSRPEMALPQPPKLSRLTMGQIAFRIVPRNLNSRWKGCAPNLWRGSKIVVQADSSRRNCRWTTA